MGFKQKKKKNHGILGWKRPKRSSIPLFTFTDTQNYPNCIVLEFYLADYNEIGFPSIQISLPFRFYLFVCNFFVF